jgi:hypothetical protein
LYPFPLFGLPKYTILAAHGAGALAGGAFFVEVVEAIFVVDAIAFADQNLQAVIARLFSLFNIMLSLLCGGRERDK